MFILETEVNSKALPKTKIYAKWYPTTCDEEMKDLFVDVYGKDVLGKIYYKNDVYTIGWKPCIINKSDIIVGTPEYDPFVEERKLADKINFEEDVIEGEEADEKRKLLKRKKPVRKRRMKKLLKKKRKPVRKKAGR